MLSRVVSQLSKLSTLLFWLQSFEILIGARLSGQYNLEKQTQQTEANDSFGPEGPEVLDMFLFFGQMFAFMLSNLTTHHHHHQVHLRLSLGTP